MADGAIVYVQYYGLIEQQYLRTNPRFETSDPRYAWLQQSVFIGQGRISEGLGVEYHVFRIK